MRRIGVVSEVYETHAVVKVSRKSACEGCHANAEGACGACVAFGDREVTSKAENSIGAKVGDRVLLETESKTVVLYAAAVFLFPIILGIIGYFVGGLLAHTAAPYIGVLAGFVLAFVTVWLTLNRVASRRLDVKIVRIL